jgi:SNF2 family DNA or RNA helicase
MHKQDIHQSKLREFLLQHATFSLLDSAQKLLDKNSVIECSKSASRINAIVVISEEPRSSVIAEEEDSEETLEDIKIETLQYSVKLDLISKRDIEATCDCSNREEMSEQWCPHAIATVLRAEQLGFFDSDDGFSSLDSHYKINTSSPREIAKVLEDVVGQQKTKVNNKSTFLPQVSIALNLSGDRLGVQVYFDDKIQSPTLFDGIEQLSSRALDNVLVQILEDEGSWDQDRHLWYINSSKSIEAVIGLIKEYKDVYDQVSGKKIKFENSELDAQLKVSWLENAVQCSMSWFLPDGATQLKERDLIGTGPYWVAINNSLCPVAKTAAKIAGIFPHTSTLTIPRTQTGPLLEVLMNFEKELGSSELIKIENQNLQPKSVIKNPKPELDIELREKDSEHFSSNDAIEFWAQLDFEYPSPKDSDNVVYLPNRKKEEAYKAELLEKGFYYSIEKKRFIVEGDAALDFISEPEPLGKSWNINGISQIQKKLRFAKLKLNISVTSAESAATQNKKGISQSIDWFDCHISLHNNSASVPISTLFKNYNSQANKWVRLDNGAFAKVPGGGIKQLKAMLGMLEGNYRLSNNIKTKLTSAQAISLSRAHDSDIEVQCDKKIKELSKKVASFDSVTQLSATKNFTGKLRPYQKDGLSWLGFLHGFQFSGILADEMGLGKTVQTLAFLQFLIDGKSKKLKFEGPTLIIAPTSVITNWVLEGTRFCPKLKVLLLHGPQRKVDFKQIPTSDIVITSYALLRIDRYELEKHQFGYVILDEAQNIKNPQAATTRAAKALKSGARLALSGTPTENRPVELWSIFDFLMPGYLGSYDFFKSHIEKPILESGPGVDVARLLNTKTKPFILRRLKSEVEKDLPAKTESVLYVPMTNSQRSMYAQILEEVRPKVFEAVKQKGIAGASVSILAALLRLRQVCNHPNSIDAFKELEGFDSGKLQALKELVTEALEAGRKIILFSQFREMLAIIRRWLEEERVNYLYLDGQTTKRQDLVDRFNNDSSIQLFLMSLKAGGTGINLTAADTVIIYDPWWNPAVESQAVDRAHRIGQKKAVSVYRLVTEDSIEQKIMQLKERKSEMVDALINENGLSTLTLSREDLESFFTPMSIDSL